MFVYAQEVIDRVFGLLAAGKNPSEVSQITTVSERTIERWLATGRPSRALPNAADLLHSWSKPAYAYLLGLYLGDGCLVHVHRGVFRLQLTLDARYPGIVVDACESVRAVLPSNKVRASQRMNAIDVTCCSKFWQVLFPQHGPGKKHERDIHLTRWQQDLTSSNPRELIRGLIHSDGCRYLARPVVNGREYKYVRYSFRNRSEDILRIFSTHLSLIGIHWTRSTKTAIQVARRASVADLDSFVGPKR